MVQWLLLATSLSWALLVIACPRYVETVSPAIAKHERVESWECPSAPGTACLLHGKVMQETIEGPVSFPLSSSERTGGAACTPELLILICPVLAWGHNMDHTGLHVLEGRWCEGLGAAPFRAEGTSSVTPLCSLEGDQMLPPGLFGQRGSALPSALPVLPEQEKAWDLQSGQDGCRDFIDCSGRHSHMNDCKTWEKIKNRSFNKMHLYQKHMAIKKSLKNYIYLVGLLHLQV